MSKPTITITINQTDPLQQALDNLVAKGLVEIIGTRKGQQFIGPPSTAMAKTQARASHPQHR